MKMLERIADGIVLVITSLSSIVMVIVIFAQVFCRYILRSPLYWSEEMARYSFIYIVFIGGAWAGKEYAHLGVDFFINKMPANIQHYIRLFTDIAIMLFSGFIVVIAILTLLKLGHQKSPALGIPMYYPYAAIPTGFLLLMFYYLLHFVEHLNRHGE